jgi:Tol biopolymer transport system component
LSWSQDGKFLVFEFGRSASDRAIYLANADGTGLVKLVDSAHAPTISSDGNCLAYISNKQAFLLDLKNTTATPLLIADLPAGRSTSDFRLDKLQWKP